MFGFSSPYGGCFARIEPESYLDMYRGELGKDPTLIVEEETRWVNVNFDYGLDYGRSLGCLKQDPPARRSSKP